MKRVRTKRYRLLVFSDWLGNWADVAYSASKAYLHALGDELATKNPELRYMLDRDGGDETLASWNE